MGANLMTKMDRVARGPPILAAAATVTLVISVELKLMRQNLPIKKLAHQVVWCDWNYINETVKQVLFESKKSGEIQICSNKTVPTFTFSASFWS